MYMVYNADDLKKWDCQAEIEEGRWVSARPINYRHAPILHRIKVAWRVFRGKYDALEWTGQ